MSLVPGRRLGHYEILAKVGEGGMGVVYKAQDTHLDRLVAIKVLPPASVADAERKRRFTQEAKAASALNHPNIITIYDITAADGTDFIAMEYVQGKTLGELIGRKGLPLKDTLSYASQAASALAKAHAAGIIHRDLKPSNIMVTDDGLVKILDFGVAKLTTTSDGGDEQLVADAQTMTAGDRPETAAGGIVGTAAYMSPEQAEGRKVDARTDIFSFGAVLYEMVTGTRAFQGPSSVQTLAAVVNAEPPPPSQRARDLPRELERIILRCLRKDPARRFQHIEDLAVELEELKAASGTQIAAVQGPSRRRRVLWVSGATAAVALTAAGAWFLRPAPKAPLPPPILSRLTAFPGDERSATFSPDGSQVAFAWNGENGANSDIYVMPVGASTAVRLTTDPAQDTTPAWSPDGNHIAFVRRQGNAAAVYLTTPPVPNSEQKLVDIRPVDTGLTLTDLTTFSWFPDSKRLAVAQRDADGQMNGIVLIPIGPDEPKKFVWTETSRGLYLYPSVSPDGQRVAYALCPGRFNCDIFVREVAGDFTSTGKPQRLTTQNSSVRGIAWTPDGESLIYGSGTLISYLWRVPLLVGQPERLELPGDQAAFPAVSSRGSTLAFTRISNNADIWKFEANERQEPFLSTTLDDRNAQFSPDGKRIAFESRRMGHDTQIFVANADGSNPRALTEGAAGAGGSPRWSPDSHSIFYDGQEPDGRRSIYRIDADGGQPKRLVTPGAVPSMSHDGKWVYFNDAARPDRLEVWRIPAAGGERVQITDNGGSNALEAPDGTLYYIKAGVPGVLFTRAVDGGAERPVLDSMRSGPHQYFPVKDGIYYAACPDQKSPFTCELRFLEFATGKHTPLYTFESRTGNGLSVSPDQKTILYSGSKPSDGDDLGLIRNFR